MSASGRTAPAPVVDDSRRSAGGQTPTHPIATEEWKAPSVASTAVVVKAEKAAARPTPRGSARQDLRFVEPGHDGVPRRTPRPVVAVRDQLLTMMPRISPRVATTLKRYGDPSDGRIGRGEFIRGMMQVGERPITREGPVITRGAGGGDRREAPFHHLGPEGRDAKAMARALDALFTELLHCGDDDDEEEANDDDGRVPIASIPARMRRLRASKQQQSAPLQLPRVPGASPRDAGSVRRTPRAGVVPRPHAILHSLPPLDVKTASALAGDILAAHRSQDAIEEGVRGERRAMAHAHMKHWPAPKPPPGRLSAHQRNSMEVRIMLNQLLRDDDWHPSAVNEALGEYVTDKFKHRPNPPSGSTGADSSRSRRAKGSNPRKSRVRAPKAGAALSTEEAVELIYGEAEPEPASVPPSLRPAEHFVAAPGWGKAIYA